METKEKRTRKVVVGVLVLASLLGLWTLATAGNLSPSAPPAPTMRTLDEIYDAIVTGSSSREGYLNQLNVPAGNTTLFTVPTGKQFVLLKMYLRSPYEYLTKNGSFLTGGFYTCNGGESGLFTFMDFPNRCVVLNSGDTLGIQNDVGGSIATLVVGYFCNAQ
jgi:hypothetical protein